METQLPNWFPDDDGLVTHYIKKYPDRYKLIQYKTPYPKEAKPKDPDKPTAAWLQPDQVKANSLADSISRTKTRLADITICNEFDLFVTFTLNCRACVPKCLNNLCTCDKTTCKRYDLDYAKRTQEAWYNNQTKRFPYVQVMEFHKDGSIHFHALFKDYPGRLKPWKRDKAGRQIYILPGYRKGYSTAKKIYDISGTSSYIRKYIMKEMPVFHGKKRFWASQGLKRPIIIQDDKLAEQILSNPKSETWEPDKVILKASGEVENNTSNLESITTLMVDNKADYLYELEALESIEKFLKAMDG